MVKERKMPIMPLDMPHKLVSLKLNSDTRGLYLQFAARAAAAYTLCFSSQTPVTRDTIDLSEQDLVDLYHGKRIRKGDYRYQGVSRGAVAGTPMFRDFEVNPPEQIQIFAMEYDPFSRKAGLYVPEDPDQQIVFVPLRFHVERKYAGGLMILTVTLVDQGEHTKGSNKDAKRSAGGYTSGNTEGSFGRYTDGTLSYQVGDSLPIPIPQAFLGKPMPIRMRNGDQIRVVVSEEMLGKFSEI